MSKNCSFFFFFSPWKTIHTLTEYQRPTFSHNMAHNLTSFLLSLVTRQHITRRQCNTTKLMRISNMFASRHGVKRQLIFWLRDLKDSYHFSSYTDCFLLKEYENSLLFLQSYWLPFFVSWIEKHFQTLADTFHYSVRSL